MTSELDLDGGRVGTRIGLEGFCVNRSVEVDRCWHWCGDTEDIVIIHCVLTIVGYPSYVRSEDERL